MEFNLIESRYMLKILFSDRYGLTDAVLKGRKTMTRRSVSDKIIAKAKAYQQEYFAATLDAISLEDAILEFSPYKVGEEVAIAQAYENLLYNIGTEEGAEKFNTLSKTAGWANKMFVKAELMPHRLRITDIRIERLRDISFEDCVREGVIKNGKWREYNFALCGFSGWFRTPREAFAALIDKVSGKDIWENNPYVWVYSFELSM